MTYRTLIIHLKNLTEEQLDMNITVEISIEEEFFPAELRICGKEHSTLDENHPVIFVE